MTVTDTSTAPDDLDAKLAALADEATKIVNTVDEAAREFTPEENDRIKAIFDEATGLKAHKAKAAERMTLREQIGGLVTAEEAKEANAKAIVPTRQPGRKDEALSPADLFVQDPSMKSWMGQFPNGLPDTLHQWRTPTVLIPGGLKALIVHTDVPVWSDRRPEVYPTYQRPLTIRSLVTNGTTGSDTIEFARMLPPTNAADVVPEATDTTGTSGTKPQSDMAFEKVTTPVRTIAHWLAATKRSLSDFGQLRTLINTFLRYGIEEKLEDEIMTGDGTGEHFLGLLNTPGTLAQPFDTDTVTTIRKAITTLQLQGRVSPTAIVLNPADDEAFDLLKDPGTGSYIQGNLVPWVAGQPRSIWGVTRVVSEAMPAGTALMGYFPYAILWDRESVTITATDSHLDWFTRNIIAVLGEARAAFGVLQPTAFIEVGLTGAVGP